MKPLLEISCIKCGFILPPRFSLSGPHIKASCDSCGAYNKFFNPNLIPDAEEIKQAIWYLINQDLNLINKFKEETGFIPNGSKNFQKLQYWKIYLLAYKHYQNLAK